MVSVFPVSLHFLERHLAFFFEIPNTFQGKHFSSCATVGAIVLGWQGILSQIVHVAIDPAFL